VAKRRGRKNAPVTRSHVYDERQKKVVVNIGFAKIYIAR